MLLVTIITALFGRSDEYHGSKSQLSSTYPSHSSSEQIRKSLFSLFLSSPFYLYIKISLRDSSQRSYCNTGPCHPQSYLLVRIIGILHHGLDARFRFFSFGKTFNWCSVRFRRAWREVAARDGYAVDVDRGRSYSLWEYERKSTTTSPRVSEESRKRNKVYNEGSEKWIQKLYNVWKSFSPTTSLATRCQC